MPKNSLHVSEIYFNHYDQMNVVYQALELSKYLYGIQANVSCWVEEWDEHLTTLFDYMARDLNPIRKKECVDYEHVKIIDSGFTIQRSQTDEHTPDNELCKIVINPEIRTVEKINKNGILIKVEKIDTTGNSINYVGDLTPEYLLVIPNNNEIIKKSRNYTSEKKMQKCGLLLKPELDRT